MKKKILEQKNESGMQKIDELEEDDNKLNMISSSLFNKLTNSCKKMVLKAEQKNQKNLFLVAKSFIQGINNFPVDVETGVKYLECAVNSKNADAMVLYGKLLNEGKHVPKNEEKSVNILTEAATDFNNSDAKYELAKIILSHESFGVDDSNDDINYILAKKYCKEAADDGNIKAMVLYGKLSKKEKKNKFGELHYDSQEIIKYFKLAAEKNDAEGMALYGKCIELGDATMIGNPDEAINLYNQSYDKDDMTGCAFLGLALFKGIGNLEKNEEDGSALIKLSSDNNNPYGIAYAAKFLTNDLSFAFECYKK